MIVKTFQVRYYVKEYYNGKNEFYNNVANCVVAKDAGDAILKVKKEAVKPRNQSGCRVTRKDFDPYEVTLIAKTDF